MHVNTFIFSQRLKSLFSGYFLLFRFSRIAMMKHQLLFFPFLASFLCYTQCLARKEDVYIPVLAPMFGIENDRFGFVTAMKYAFELINNRSDILRDYRLVAEYHDTIVSSTVGAACMGGFNLDYFLSNLDYFFKFSRSKFIKEH